MSAWPPPPLDPTPLQRPWRRPTPRLDADGEPLRLPGSVHYAIVMGIVLAAGLGLLHLLG